MRHALEVLRTPSLWLITSRSPDTSENLTVRLFHVRARRKAHSERGARRLRAPDELFEKREDGQSA